MSNYHNNIISIAWLHASKIGQLKISPGMHTRLSINTTIEENIK